jgi:nocardicin N-oxygenase
MRAYRFGPAQGLELDPELGRLRADRAVIPISLPYGNGPAWGVLRLAEARMVLSDPRFSAAAAAAGADTPRMTPDVVLGGTILGLDPPEHSRLRTLVAKAFTERRVQALRPRVETLAAGLVDTAIATSAGPAGRRPVDLAAALAMPLPIVVICELLGVPEHDHPDFVGWSQEMISTGISHEDMVAVQTRFYEYLAGLAGTRRRQLADTAGAPPDDLMTALITARDRDDRLSEDELVLLVLTMLVAGHETTASQLSCALYLTLAGGWWAELAERLAAYDAAGDRQRAQRLLAGLVEEQLRFVPLLSGGLFCRVATEDVQVGEVLVRAGEAVLPMHNAVNRDASVWAGAEDFDPYREAAGGHLSFGHGVHHCLGAPLARMELRVAMGELLRRFPGLRPAVPVRQVRWRSGTMFRRPQALPVTW